MIFTYLGELVLSKYWILWLVFAYFVLPFFAYLIVPFVISRNATITKDTVSILVLGDLGHSPRMCYHAMSFASRGFLVNLCGYLETAPPNGVVDNLHIDVYPIRAIQNNRRLPYLIFAATKAVRQVFQLFELLVDLRDSKYFVLQNPPSMPLLFVLVVFVKIFCPRARIIIDWHNLNFSILALKFTPRHPLVRLMRFYEKFLARYAWMNFAVTQKMKDFLVDDFGLQQNKVRVLHDRPGTQFALVEAEKPQILASHDIFAVDNIAQYKIIVSATSFTPDEDFEVLVDALKQYHDSDSLLPPIFVVITGKGPLKEQFLALVERQNFLDRVVVRLAWLLAEDYPRILGVADLAVSLHTSLSGIDLPMKILDFFGVGVPVVTLLFPAIAELVHDGVNGLVAPGIGESGPELASLIRSALGDPALMHTLKAGAVKESEHGWQANWDASVGDLFS